jgi:hypothetical protein
MTTEFRLSFTAREFETIKQEISDLIKGTRPDVWSDFFESNIGVALVDLAAFIGDMVSAGQDAAAVEWYLSTCQRYESALRFANSVGYIPRSATPAEVTVKGVSLPSQLVLNGGTVPAGTVISSQEGLQYELLEDVLIDVGASVSRLTLYEGTSYEETFDPSSEPSQVITPANGVVAEGSWSVYVGDASDPANLWTQVEKVSFEESATETYEVSFDGEGRLVITFGDNTAGKIPDDTITVQYRTTAGFDGNVPLLSIRGSVKINLTGGLGTVSVVYENSEEAASGGADRESLAELKVNIPAYIRSQDKIITLNDYNTSVLRVSGIALVFTDLLIASYSANIVRVHVWTTEEVTFTSEDALGTTADAAYERYATLPLSGANDVQEYLGTRTPVTTLNTIIRPGVAQADVYLGDVFYDPSWAKEDVQQRITEAVVAVFEASDGFRIRFAELYNAVRDVEGVSYFYIERIVFEKLDKPAATGTVELLGQPSETDTITISDGATTRTFEFDTDDTVTPGNVDVNIGADALETLANLIDAINANLSMRAYRDVTTINPTAVLDNLTPGEGGNVVILKVGANIVVTGMAGGSDTPATLQTDYRREQEPIEDAWPEGTYDPPTPGDPWVDDGGIKPYEPLQDLLIEAAVGTRRFYDETYAYNNEIRYDAGLGETSLVQAVNLRRLFMRLVATE